MLKSGSKGVDTTHLCVNTNFSIFSIPQLIRGTRAMIPINSSELLFNGNVASTHKHMLVVLLSIPAPYKYIYIYIVSTGSG